MKYKKGFGEISFDIFNNIFMIFFLIITLYPMWYVVVASISDASLLMTHNGFLIRPLGLDLSTYSYVLHNPRILRGFVNTGIIVVVGTSLNVLMTTIAAYFLSRRDLYWKKIVMIMIVITMFIGGGLIPLYLIVRSLGLVNSLWSLMLPNLVSAFNVIVMRTYFQGIPREIEESGVVDGANHFVILFRLIVPVSMPVIAVMILWYGVGYWNAWFDASIYINKMELFPIQLVLRQILIEGSILQAAAGSNLADEQKIQFAATIKYAVIVVATLPVVCIYPYLQKYFVKGVMIGAIKG